MKFTVTAAAQRPARMDGTCFYCHQKIGEHHNDNCVLITRKVRVRLTVEYDIKVPACWEKGMIEFHRNESSWCSDNLIDELAAIVESDHDCLCNHHAKFTYLHDSSAPFLKED